MPARTRKNYDAHETSLTCICSRFVIAHCARSQAMTSDGAIRQAINLDLAAARYSISVADARQITAKLRPNPVVSVSADHLDLLGTGYNTINNGGRRYFFRTIFILERGGKRAARNRTRCRTEAHCRTRVSGCNAQAHL